MFTIFYPNVVASFRVSKMPCPFLTTLPNGDLKATSQTIKEQEHIQIRKLTGNIVTMKSCYLNRHIVVDEKGAVRAELEDNIKSTKSERLVLIVFWFGLLFLFLCSITGKIFLLTLVRWILERQPNGTTRVKSAANNAYLAIARNGILVSTNDPQHVSEFYIIYHFAK